MMISSLIFYNYMQLDFRSTRRRYYTADKKSNLRANTYIIAVCQNIVNAIYNA